MSKKIDKGGEVICVRSKIGYTVGVKFNLASVQEDTRRLGIVLVAAGILGALFIGAKQR